MPPVLVMMWINAAILFFIDY